MITLQGVQTLVLDTLPTGSCTALLLMSAVYTLFAQISSHHAFSRPPSSIWRAYLLCLNAFCTLIAKLSIRVSDTNGRVQGCGKQLGVPPAEGQG